MSKDLELNSLENKIIEAQKLLEKLIDPEITLSSSVEVYKNGMKELEIAQKLLDQNDFEIPLHMLDTEVKNISAQYEGMQQKIDDKVKSELDLIARKRVKLNLIYMKLTEEHKLTVSEKDVYEFISKSDPATQEQLIQKAKEDKNYLNHIKNKLLEDAIIDLIASKCSIKKIKKRFIEVVN